jgi:molybdopterin-guanine dinucleotide biosynthesis protein A
MMHKEITGVILAGGRSTRMAGEDKGLIQLGDKALYQHVLDRLMPQVGHLIICANRNQQRYRESGLPVVSDLTADFPGPLGGILSGLHYANTDWIVCAPCDVPDLPHSLVEHLWQHKGTALAAYASDGERTHPTLTLLHTSLFSNLKDYLDRGERKLMLFMAAIDAQQVIFSNQQQAFRNLNTPEDCQQWLQEKGFIDG